MPRNHARWFLLLSFCLAALCCMVLCSCEDDGTPIDRPDEFTHVYDASEKYILRAAYQIVREKELGKPAIDEGKHEVTSDYLVQEGWRFRSTARVRKISRSENELTLSVVTEKKTPAGWELRRLLGKEQYDKIFDAIQTQIFREMYKMD